MIFVFVIDNGNDFPNDLQKVGVYEKKFFGEKCLTTVYHNVEYYRKNLNR